MKKERKRRRRRSKREEEEEKEKGGKKKDMSQMTKNKLQRGNEKEGREKKGVQTFVPAGASGRRARTMWRMFSVKSCSPQEMKIFVPVSL